ncbi:stemmadenine O-acetyltransferase-like [Lycium ferocissimum]|uniref:stemmadenine O-acetyltransferase-like n=1 Tax=Lycium ferocissimum TaxID=112874 RepID=UPI0028166AB6|nr:stemmadenine O-acetyltransferase-like [Lycium ferocissimum]
MEKKIEIISKQLIKPSVCHVESFNFSALDQLASPTHYPIFLYYPHDQESTNLSTRSLQLKVPCPKFLLIFILFFGRLINDNTSISYNNSKDDDFGVLFIEAFTHNYNLQEILLSGSKTNTLEQFVPPMDSLLKTHLLVVQVTVFECGGMILGCLVSHKLSDASSICTFINNWAAAARGANNSNSLTPDFTSVVKVFPPTKQPSPLPFANPVGGEEKQIITKIFSFDGPSIADLKSKALSKDVPGPTSVEAVSALIWKCATVSSKSSTGMSTLSLVVNLRKRLVPSLPGGTIGNLLAFFVATKSNERDKNDLSNLVTILRKGLLEFPSLNWDVALDHIVENWNKLDLISRNNDTEFYSFSSWCGVPFYEADFGWGKPKWISTMIQYKNLIVLMDAKDGGIEAWVCLEVKHMSEFEQNPDLLDFATTK